MSHGDCNQKLKKNQNPLGSNFQGNIKIPAHFTSNLDIFWHPIVSIEICSSSDFSKQQAEISEVFNWSLGGLHWMLFPYYDENLFIIIKHLKCQAHSQ